MSVPAVRSALSGVVVDPGTLAERAAEVACQQAAPLTRDAYAGVYRAFCAFAGAGAGADALTPTTVRAYRDQLEQHGRSPATIAKHLSALRALATALGAESIGQVRGSRVAPGEPRALTIEQYERLLRMPDQRTTLGKRDLALLHLLGTAGLRRAEACALLIDDVDERQRANDGPSPGYPPLHQLVGHRPLRQARPPPRHPPRAARARRDHRLGACSTHLHVRPAARLAPPDRPRPPLSHRARHHPDRRSPRGGCWTARRSTLPTRPAPHVLHTSRRLRPTDRGDPRARRPRRHPHHHDLHRRRRATPRGRNRGR